MNGIPLYLKTESLISNSGWGSTREGTPTIKTLMYADVPVLSDDTCRENYGNNEISESMVSFTFYF